MTGPRWDNDTRGHGVGDATAALPDLDELTRLARTPDWVAESPAERLLPPLRDADRISAWRVVGGALVVDLEPTPGDNLRAIRGRVWTLLGTVAEATSFVRERREGDAVVFHVVTGMPDSSFAGHGHTLVIRCGLLPRRVP